MEFIRTLLEQQPLMTLFLTIAIGYLVGEINIKGFSLGVGAVLFVALAMGWFAPKSVPAPMVGTLGLALFLYGVGVQYGKQFFIGLTSAAGAKGERHGVARRAAGRRREHSAREGDGLEPRLCNGPVRGVGDEHADAPGSHRHARQRRSRGRLLGVLSVRGGGADPAALHLLHGAEAEDRGALGRGPRTARDRAAQPGSLRQDARRGDERRCRPACRSWRCDGRTATSRPPPTSSSPRTTSCSSSGTSKDALAQASQEPR